MRIAGDGRAVYTNDELGALIRQVCNNKPLLLGTVVNLVMEINHLRKLAGVEPCLDCPSEGHCSICGYTRLVAVK